MTKQERLQEIHASLINGNRRQMVEQINANFILYDFWKEYLDFLKEDCGYDSSIALIHFSDAVISYHRIKGR
jgi:CRISPR/Cas system CSM-associated protein Csm2 small subunit